MANAKPECWSHNLHELHMPELYTKAEILEAIGTLPKEEQLAIYKSIIDAHYSFVHVIRVK